MFGETRESVQTALPHLFLSDMGALAAIQISADTSCGAWLFPLSLTRRTER